MSTRTDAVMPAATADVLGSWWWWTEAARAADEPTLALALDDRRPGAPYAGPDPAVPAVLRARDLLLVGRVEEADVTLDRAGATSPVGHAGYPQLVSAAVRAARGDHHAWSWLVGSAAPAWPAATVAPLVAAAADARGDRATADHAWVAAGPALTTGASLVRSSVAALATRPRDRTEALGPLVAGVAWRTLGRRHEPDVATALAVAEALAARDDRAGARLLLHAVDVRVPASAAVRGAIKRLTPSQVGYWVAGAVVVTLLAGLGAVAALHGDVGVMRFATPLVLLGFLSVVRIPGLTRAESSVWRELRGKVYDAERGRTTSRELRTSGWYTVAGIAGAALAGIADATVVASVGRALSGDAAWATTDAALGVFAAIVVLGAVAGVLATRVLVRATVRRRRARRTAAEASARAQAGSTCRCTTDRWLEDPLASDYAELHLVTVPGVAAPAPGATLQRCPGTGTLWLTGPVGAGGRRLALSGRPPAPAHLPTAVPQPYGR